MNQTKNWRWLRRAQRDAVLREAARDGVAPCQVYPCPAKASWAAWYRWAGRPTHVVLCDEHAVEWVHVQSLPRPPLAPYTTVVGPA